MFSGPTSRAVHVGHLKEEEEEEEEGEEEDEITYLPISIRASNMQAVLAMLGYFMDKRPLQKHSKLYKKP